MSDFKAEMHQYRFRLGLFPDSAERAYSALRPPRGVGIEKEKGGESREGERERSERRERKRRKGRGGKRGERGDSPYQ